MTKICRPIRINRYRRRNQDNGCLAIAAIQWISKKRPLRCLLETFCGIESDIRFTSHLRRPLYALLHPGEGQEDPLLGNVVEEAEAAGVALDEGVQLEAAEGRQGDAVTLKQRVRNRIIR